jgi:hypothetical protein
MTENVLSKFPHPELTSLADTRPTFLSRQRLHAEIQSNAESVPSIRGNGELGHLALTISAAKCLIESNGVAFDPPIHPGAAPDHPAGATAPIITEINHLFLANQKEFTLYTSVAANLKRQLLKAVPELYIEDLRHPTRNFSRVSMLAILNHLDTNYGTITTDNLAANRTANGPERNPWRPSGPALFIAATLPTISTPSPTWMQCKLHSTTLTATPFSSML